MSKHLAAALALAAALTACGTTTSAQTARPSTAPAAAAEQKGSLDTSPLRVAAADFQAAESPEALAAGRPIVAAGVIDGWQQGPILESYPNGPLDYRIVLRVRITEPLKGVAGRASIANGLIHIALDQGPVIRDDALPADQWKPEKDVQDFATAMPPGTRVLVFPREMPEGALGKVRDAGAALPPRAKLMSVPPQGIVLEDPALKARAIDGQTALVGGREPLNVGGSAWSEPKNMDELVARLKQRGFDE
ncbi:hypothetical protein [Nonomuraea rhodomycinica]|uniref:Lipoprotein n=1 Tax=Nonomuraea rhodomycinica TaxID=1712872 RepID=A0A7Y6IVC6_9ACTN|nr:hypothetical protein [Nonomuraea rhodomycinica]NUW44980.1 hypothetical protein [Nonomuraea rhodomycinica]